MFGKFSVIAMAMGAVLTLGTIGANGIAQAGPVLLAQDGPGNLSEGARRRIFDIIRVIAGAETSYEKNVIINPANPVNPAKAANVAAAVATAGRPVMPSAAVVCRRVWQNSYGNGAACHPVYRKNSGRAQQRLS